MFDPHFLRDDHCLRARMRLLRASFCLATEQRPVFLNVFSLCHTVMIVFLRQSTLTFKKASRQKCCVCIFLFLHESKRPLNMASLLASYVRLPI